MNNIGVLMTRPMLEYLEKQLEARFNLFKAWTLSSSKPDFFKNHSKSIKAVVGDTTVGADATMIDSLPNLEIVASYSVGLDKIDLEKCKEKGIKVTNTPDVLTDDVADLGIGLALAVLRKICVCDQFVKSGNWINGDLGLASKFSGKSVGIVGLGRIGSAIAKRSEAFNCRISYHSRSEKPNTNYKYYSNIVDLAANCQILIVACALTEETHHIVNREVIDALGPKGILINIGRGAHVDEPELVSALLEGRLGGAGLDVFENEPDVPEELFALQNVVLVPHVGSDTEETSKAMADLVISNLEAHFKAKLIPRQMNGGYSIEDTEEHHQVMSEIHLGCPPGISGPHISRFTICLPPGVESSRFNGLFQDEESSTDQDISFDEDGDLVLPRRRQISRRCFTMKIQHNITSSIPSAGLQVWKAELVLSDFVLHKMCTSMEFHGIVSLELGAGTGLAGMLLAHAARTVFLTDHSDKILDNCLKNVQLNSGVNHQNIIYVRQLDWTHPWPPKASSNLTSQERFSWSLFELEEVQKASLLLAADVIYSDELTDALFGILDQIMSQGSEKVLYLALEKRYNFSLDDLDVVANGYSKFRSYLKDNSECEGLEPGSESYFMGRCINVAEIPQYVGGYDRGTDVELWEIRYNKDTALIPC